MLTPWSHDTHWPHRLDEEITEWTAAKAGLRDQTTLLVVQQHIVGADAANADFQEVHEAESEQGFFRFSQVCRAPVLANTVSYDFSALVIICKCLCHDTHRHKCQQS